MEVVFEGKQARIIGSGMDIDATLFCGQAFRYERRGDEAVGVACGRELHLVQTGEEILLMPVNKEEFPLWRRYFDLDRDYEALKKRYAADPILQAGIKYCGGLHVLNQPPFETTISFIISANNNIKRISGIIRTICERFGMRIGEEVYDFPTPEALASVSVEDLYACGAGYRAPYILKTARMVTEGFDLSALSHMDYLEARQALTKLPGVGNKVADCILLYSLGFSNAFPMDVWMKRVLSSAYGFTAQKEADVRAFLNRQFGEEAGIAQQYLFHYARHAKIGV